MGCYSAGKPQPKIREIACDDDASDAPPHPASRRGRRHPVARQGAGLCPGRPEEADLRACHGRARILGGRVRRDGQGGDRALEGRAGDGVPRRHPADQGTRDHQRGQVRQHRDGRSGRRRRDRVPGDGRVPGALPGRQLRPGLQDVQRRDRRPARQAVPGEIQAQGPVLLRLRLPPFLEQQTADRRAARICAA